MIDMDHAEGTRSKGRKYFQEGSGIGPPRKADQGRGCEREALELEKSPHLLFEVPIRLAITRSHQSPALRLVLRTPRS